MFKSENLEFREIDPLTDNLENYLNWIRDPISNPYIQGANINMTLESLVDYVRKKNSAEDCVLWGIYHRQNLNHIGNIKFEPIRSDLGLACVGILIGETDYRGRGYGSEAFGSALAFFSENFGIPNFYLGVDPKNIAAVAMYENQGFSFNQEMSLLHRKNIMTKFYRS